MGEETTPARPRLLDLDVELVPEQTGDDTDSGWGGTAPESKAAELRRFLEDKPPHHGD
jgi:hypothetical protein